MDYGKLIQYVKANLPEYVEELYLIASHLRTHHTDAAQAKGEALQDALDDRKNNPETEQQQDTV